MKSELTTGETTVEPVETQTSFEAPEPSAPRGPVTTGPPAYLRHRFRALYILLAVVLGAAAAGVILAATGGHVGASAPAWSDWEPNATGTTGAKQIAAHVSKQYHLPSGEQLVEVLAKPPSVSPADQQIPLHYIVVQRKKSNDPAIPINSGDTVQYSLCGLGDNCGIATGKPSVQRGTLVRREILELALYTFKYMAGVKNVIAFMPPTPGSTPKYVVYLRRDDLSPELHEPLTHTLSPKTPLPNTISRKDQQTIDATTESKVFQFGLSQAQNGDAVLVLKPLSA